VCGICGVVDLRGAAPERAALEEMAGAIAHRGPDAEGIVRLARDGNGGVGVGLVHRRLAIIDLSPSGAQPMTNEDETVWVVLNGEIYNFRELRKDLEARGHPFKSHSDTEVILHLYEERGERCVDALDGMFAFGLWDARRQRLLLARDRAGKKPLFYARVGSQFAFASEVKALLRHPLRGAAPAVDTFPHYFAFGYPPPGRTFYQGIRELPPAHRLTLDADGTERVTRYWDVSFRPAVPACTEREATARVRDLLAAAVEKRLVADVPLGAFLSGGVDSSVVVALMARLTGAKVRTFSLGFSGAPAFDETPWARRVARHCGTEHTEFIVEPSAVGLVERLVHHHDGPFGDSSAIPTFLVSELTRRHVTVALNGDGGDEIFAGYLRFQGSVAAERLPRGLARIAGRVAAALPEPRGYHHPLRRARRFFTAAALPLLARLREWNAVFGDDLPRLLSADVWPEVRRSLEFPPEATADAGDLTPLGQVLQVNFKTYLPGDLLVKIDRCSMAHGLEGRSPFLDTALVEYAASLPDALKLRRGTTKYILKRAFADLLPPEILGRGKRGFGVPLGAWFRGELREYLRDLLIAPGARAHAYVDAAYVRRLVSDHEAGHHDYGHKLWSLLTFEVWLRGERMAA
jgi:asparagine synthase (glutamine-hydrolysing)